MNLAASQDADLDFILNGSALEVIIPIQHYVQVIAEMERYCLANSVMTAQTMTKAAQLVAKKRIQNGSVQLVLRL